MKQTKQFEAHERCVSNVKINPRAENVFLTCGLDGLLKVWDMRNEQTPLFLLKKHQASASEAEDEAKLFGLTWNGTSQILSGGSDGRVTVHQM